MHAHKSAGASPGEGKIECWKASTGPLAGMQTGSNTTSTTPNSLVLVPEVSPGASSKAAG
jgi:hypothetical protein